MINSEKIQRRPLAEVSLRCHIQYGLGNQDHDGLHVPNPRDGCRRGPFSGHPAICTNTRVPTSIFLSSFAFPARWLTPRVFFALLQAPVQCTTATTARGGEAAAPGCSPCRSPSSPTCFDPQAGPTERRRPRPASDSRKERKKMYSLFPKIIIRIERVSGQAFWGRGREEKHAKNAK